MTLEDYELALTIGDFSAIKGIHRDVYGNMYLSKLTLENWEHLPIDIADHTYFYYKLSSEIQNDESVVLLAFSKLEPQHIIPYVSHRVMSKVLKQAFAIALQREYTRGVLHSFETYVEDFLNRLTPHPQAFKLMQEVIFDKDLPFHRLYLM